MTDPTTVRIFISAPIDVRPERLIAQRVVERLDREFAYHFHVEALLWEREPLVATHHFQDDRNLPSPRSTDIVAVILWSRLGVPLPADRFRGALSGRVVTGTEWEFEDALAGARTAGTPSLLVYRKNQPLTASLDDEIALAQRLQQKRLVEDFMHRWFEAADGKSFASAFQTFSSPAEFEQQIYDHLHALLERRLQTARPELGVASAIRWHQPPFRGLLSFEFEQAPVFFGRTRARNELRELLARQAEGGCAFVLMLGASGSGKSSLVKAGLIPDLMLPGMIGRVALCRTAVMRPADRPGDLLGGLAAAMMADTALPELRALRYTPERLAALLAAAPEQAALPIEQGLAEAAESAQLTEIAEARLVLVVDQLEEIFSLPGVADASRETFIQALDALARSGRVWVIATMRSDFFDEIETLPALAKLARAETRYLLAPPDEPEIGQIIGQPAREAGLRFEFDAQNGKGLDEEIRQAAAKDRGGLPLLSFLLDQLWQRRTTDGVLTFDAYRDLGGLEGALGRRANEVFGEQPPEVQAALPRVVRALASVGQGPAAAVTGRAVPLDEFPEETPARHLIEAFLSPAARLLVADGGGSGIGPRVRVAHEALLTHWDRAREQITRDRLDLQLLARLEQAAEIWASAPARRRSEFLLRSGLPLSEASEFARRRADELGAAVAAFVRTSQRTARRRVTVRLGLALSLTTAAALGVGFGYPYASEWMRYRAQRVEEAARTDIRGSLIAYSTGPGQQAADGSGSGNGPYAEALLSFLGDPTLDVNTLLLRVNQRLVQNLLQQQGRSQSLNQRPEFATNLNGTVFLHSPPISRRTFVLAMGNDHYRALSTLQGAVKDATDVAARFRAMGYDVTLRTDTTREQLLATINEFESHVTGATAGLPRAAQSYRRRQHRSAIVPVGLAITPPSSPTNPSVEQRAPAPAPDPPIANPAENTLVIVYIAGIGGQSRSRAYFAPVDAVVEKEADLDAQLLNVDELIERLRRISAAQIFMFDISRTDPFAAVSLR